ncbi:hypothetical protein CR513_03488, partial [Mucuna pruriens]
MSGTYNLSPPRPPTSNLCGNGGVNSRATKGGPSKGNTKYNARPYQCSRCITTHPSDASLSGISS